MCHIRGLHITREMICHSGKMTIVRAWFLPFIPSHFRINAIATMTISRPGFAS